MDILTDPGMFGLMAFACGVAVAAGLVKGIVGFGMPMILISGLSSVMPAEVALGWLIIPTLATNGWQALRQGAKAAWVSIRQFRVFLLVGFVLMVTAAQFVRVLPNQVFLLLIGVPVSIYAAMTLSGRALRLPPGPSRGVQAVAGTVAGFFGGISGVWGPPTVALLTAMQTPKADQVRIQGVIYGLGALALVGAHLVSGVLNSATFPVSVALTIPGLIGMWIGFAIHDRIEQETFRKLTLILLLIAGLNLVRRALFGG